MKKLLMIIPLVFLLCFTFSCQDKGADIDRFMEDGVEVVVNHLEPYIVKGKPSVLFLEESFTIDTERDEIADLGLTDIGVHFDVDSQGNIYIVSYENTEGLIFQFDRDGNLIRSFAHKGQGPGELQARNYPPLYLTVDQEDNIVISDNRNNKLAIFGREGDLVKEIKIDSNTICSIPLANGNYLSYIRVHDGSGEFITQNPLTLFNSQFEEIKELERQKVPNLIIGKRLKATYHIVSWSVSKEKIFTGFQERGYEIYIYDFGGELVQKIKKEYKQIPVPEDYKKKFMEKFEAPIFDDIRNKIYFPDSMPAFHSFFSDDDGRLFVMTYEKGENPSEYMYDIFNAEGIFISKKSLNVFHDGSGAYSIVRNGRFYCLKEKDSGYKELVVYKMRWE